MPLHPVFANAIEAARTAGRPGLSQGSVDDARALVDNGARLLGDGPALHCVRDLSVPTRAGTVSARLFAPAPVASGLIVYFHGGGWVAGSVASFDALCRAIAARTGCAVLSVDYRLAPEFPYPAGLQDAEDVVRWAAEHRRDLASGSGPLMVGGDSAGANLACVTAFKLKNDVDVALQLLFYPVLDCDFATPSYQQHGTGLSLTRDDMVWFFRHYAMQEQWTQPDISPSRGDVTGSHPVWLALAEFDVLLSEGERFAKQLKDAGASVKVHVYRGLPHGFARWFNVVAEVDEALNDLAMAARAAVSRYS